MPKLRVLMANYHQMESIAQQEPAGSGTSKRRREDDRTERSAAAADAAFWERVLSDENVQNEDSNGGPPAESVAILPYCEFLDDADVVIADEAHLTLSTPTSVRHILMRIQTPLRVAVTGTPIQNEVADLLHLLGFALNRSDSNPRPPEETCDWLLSAEPTLPDDLERIPTAIRADLAFELGARFAPLLKPSSTQSLDCRDAATLAQVLSAIAAPFIHRRGADYLETALPPLTVYDVRISLTTEQYRLYRAAADALRGHNIREDRPTAGSAVLLRHICNHPQVLLSRALTESLEELPAGVERPPHEIRRPLAAEDAPGELTRSLLDSRPVKAVLANEQAMGVLTHSQQGSTKLQAVLSLLEHYTPGDKVLLFSHSVAFLSLVAQVLEATPLPDWVSRPPEQRHGAVGFAPLRRVGRATTISSASLGTPPASA